MSMLALFLLVFLLARSNASWGDGPLCFGANITLPDHRSGTTVTREFSLHYSGLLFWRDKVVKFIGEWSFAEEADMVSSVRALSDHVSDFLISRGYAPEMVAGVGGDELPREIAMDPISASRSVYFLLHNAYSHSGTGIYDFKNMRKIKMKGEDYEQYDTEDYHFHTMLQSEDEPFMESAQSNEKQWPVMSLANTEVSQHYGRRENPVEIFADILGRYRDGERKPGVAEDLVRNRSPLLKSSFIVYQTRFVNTGGTTALNILYELLVELLGDGPNRVLLCDENNHLTPECAAPPDSAIVISGEWCHEVLADHGVAYHKGRGVQYHLGFHHYRDMCAGHIAVTDSHYLHSYLGERILGGYYWSCPMSRVMETELVGLITRDKKLTAGGGVAKENLVVIDPDFSKEYRPAAGLNITLPPGIRVVYAENIPHHEMPLLLQRAKVVVDLAIPGPERLMGEGVLNGAVPIGSSRWNGASVVDFPGVERVDAENGEEISEAIRRTVEEYPERVTKPRNAQFFGYIGSLRERTKNTLAVMSASASLHFVLSPRNLKEERECVFQTMALLHVFPLASIDILVNDEVWFARQNYPFIRQLREAGYLREDPLEPWEQEHVGVSGTSTRAQRGTKPQGWGKDTGEAWTQAKWHHERGINKAFVNIRSRADLYRAVQQQVSYEADAIRSEEQRSMVSQSELSPAWGAVVVALSAGTVFRDHRGLLRATRTVLGKAPDRNLVVQCTDREMTMVHPELPLSASTKQRWFDRFYAPHGSTFMDRGGPSTAAAEVTTEAAGTTHISSIFRCPSLDSFSDSSSGEGTGEISVLQGVVQSAAWLSLRSHYCNQLHP